ncbi:MAG: bifunctional (p)ppGpp synthetase/guanosine-3',5'-bis(diphosphate) 3'-pyrophosphohydrolase, partial [Candidatus Vogelbacteria bacterium]|nr:bifunctional (p)ppGpp synthetase/guanosine-3',5'-bis(diphosphate) 3'-pyrophosphohydrolase [Candidatus Vogelbacteria bacterium]
DQALKFAVKAHKHQVRKTEKDTPYVYHPISVGMILRDAGFNDDVVIAGILHDTIEDTGTKAEAIEKVFGKKVRQLVESVSEDKNLSYDERKHNYLEVVLAGNDETKAISIADALHNLHSLEQAIEERGDKVWKSFSRDKELTVGHYLLKVKAILKKWPHPMAKETLRQVMKLRTLVRN